MTNRLKELQFGDTYYIPANPPVKRMWRDSDIDAAFLETGNVFVDPNKALVHFERQRNK